MSIWLAVEYVLSGSAFTVLPPIACSGFEANRTANVCSQSGAGVQSSSIKARNSPLASEKPEFRAEAGPALACVNSFISSWSLKTLTTASGGGIAAIVNNNNLKTIAGIVETSQGLKTAF